jgi:prepilin-type N-terminal cleavage/methylation domain-containing protein
MGGTVLASRGYDRSSRKRRWTMIRRVNAPERRDEAGFTIIELLVVLVFIAIVAMIAIQTAFYAFDVSRLSRTVADMRGVADALVQYESIQGSVPAGSLQPVSDIKPTLAAVNKNLPTRDGWGNDLFYEPITVAGAETFRVYSFGKDATPDGEVVPGIWIDFNSDVVVEGGSFIQTKW